MNVLIVYSGVARVRLHTTKHRSFDAKVLLAGLNLHHVLSKAMASPTLIIAYRGKQLNRMMRKHRVSQKDLDSALRIGGVWNICEVEVGHKGPGRSTES